MTMAKEVRRIRTRYDVLRFEPRISISIVEGMNMNAALLQRIESRHGIEMEDKQILAIPP